MILSIIGIILGIIVIVLFFRLKNDQKMTNELHEGDLIAVKHAYEALMNDFTNYQVDNERKIVELEKQLEYKNNKVNKRIDINENELPKVIRKIVGHIEFARPLDKK
jgi:uncharacterized membrane protein YgaE (UPF0421/DUF939 family)